MKNKKIIVVSILCLLTAACGHTGPLYLAPSSPTPIKKAAPASPRKAVKAGPVGDKQ